MIFLSYFVYDSLMILIKQFFWIAYNFYQNLVYLPQRSCLDLKSSDGEEPYVFDLIFVFVAVLSGRWKRHLILTGKCLNFLFTSACFVVVPTPQLCWVVHGYFWSPLGHAIQSWVHSEWVFQNSSSHSSSMSCQFGQKTSCLLYNCIEFWVQGDGI